MLGEESRRAALGKRGVEQCREVLRVVCCLVTCC